MAASDRIAELEDLRLVEERLLRERSECEKLENKIRALTVESKSVEESGTPAIPPPPPPPHDPPSNYASSVPRRAPPPPPGAALTPDRSVWDQYAESNVDYNGAMVMHHEERSRSPPPRHSPSGSPPPRPEDSPDGPMAQSRGRSPRRRRFYGDPLEQPVTRTPTLGRSERFRPAKKDDTPGPGEYDVDISQFGDRKIRLSNGKPNDTTATMGSPATRTPVRASPASSTQRRATSATLDAALRREKQLRRELATAQRNMQQQQENISQHQAQVRQEIAHLKELVSAKKAAYEASQRTVANWRNVHSQVSAAVSALKRCVKEYAPLFEQTAHAPRFREIQARARAVAEAMASADPLLAVSSSSKTETPKPQPTQSFASSPRTSLAAGYGGVQVAAESDSPAAPHIAARSETASHEAMVKAGFVSPMRTESMSPRASRDSSDKSFNPADVAAFAKRTRRASMAIKRSEADSKKAESYQSKVSSFYGMDASRADRTLVSSPGAQSPAIRRDSRSKSPKRTDRYRTPEKRAGAGAGGPGSVISDSESRAPVTLDDQVRRVFQYYCSYGDRHNTTHMTNSKFVKVLRDSRILDNRVSFTDADICFTTVAAKSTEVVVSDGARKPTATASGRRINYEEFIEALSSIGSRKYGPKVASDEALRRLLTKHIAPLCQKIRSKGPAAADEEDEARREFQDRMLKPDVLHFVNNHRAALQSLFTRYSMLDTPTGPTVSWNSVRESHASMSQNEFMKFSSDFRIVPIKIKRVELVAFFKGASQSLQQDGLEHELTYPEFVELLALLADHIFKEDNRAGLPKTLLFRIQQLFFYMHEAGGRFQGPEPKMIRSVVRVVKEAFRNRHAAAATAAKEDTRDHQRKLTDVLMESAVET